MEGYLIPAASARVEMMVANSRFITVAERAETVEAARGLIQRMRAEFPDANHHVYAYRVGFPPSVIEGMSDAGEPSGTSGPPALAVLRGSAVGDVALVITRYFGGTKLGTGGLTRAYSEAARMVLSALALERKIQKSRYAFDLPYPLYELATRLLAEHEAQIEDQTFSGEVSLYIVLPTERSAAFIAALIELSSGAVTPVLLD